MGDGRERKKEGGRERKEGTRNVLKKKKKKKRVAEFVELTRRYVPINEMRDFVRRSIRKRVDLVL